MSDDFKKNFDLALSNAKRLSNKILIDGKKYQQENVEK